MTRCEDHHEMTDIDQMLAPYCHDRCGDHHKMTDIDQEFCGLRAALLVDRRTKKVKVVNHLIKKKKFQISALASYCYELENVNLTR